jgi:hypothetical protein
MYLVRTETLIVLPNVSVLRHIYTIPSEKETFSMKTYSLYAALIMDKNEARTCEDMLICGPIKIFSLSMMWGGTL